MKITEEMIKKISSGSIYKRGLEYFKDGRVHIKLREENTITASVDGEEIYNVRIDVLGEEITKSICTCPYYQTMGANCKHIVATLKKRQREILDGASFKDENDRLAKGLCTEFSDNLFKKQRLNLGFSLNITTDAKRNCSFFVGIKCGFDEVKAVNGIDKFIGSYIDKTDFKISKHVSINSQKYSLSSTDKNIMEILSESYLNKLSTGMYVERISQIEVSKITAKRLLPLFLKSDCEITVNGMSLTELRVLEENPDIIIDINATDEEISLNVFESGVALFDDGSWFLYDNCLYHTDFEWREWFMPIYKALMSESRTQIDFKGSTRIDFATYVYPKLRYRQGVITTGIDSIIVDEKPQFSVFLDYKNKTLSAVLKVSYGNINISLSDNDTDIKKIVLRDFELEEKLKSYFKKFSKGNGTYETRDTKIIYDFITKTVKEIGEFAKIYADENVQKLNRAEALDFKTKVTYKEDIDLLELEFETELSPDEVYKILKAVKLKEKFYQLNDESFISLEDEKIKNFKLLENFDFTERDIKKGKKILSKYHMLYIEALKKAGRVKTDDTFDDLIKNIKSIKAEIPKNLKGILREYQKDGVLWLKQLSSLGLGGILADDMGLGKTLEVIAFVMGEKRDLPVLVITPSALTYNWLNEINKFTPYAKVLIVDGTKEERDNVLKDISGYDFVITSYPMLRRDIEKYQDLEFSYMFIDESQNIKNPDTMSAKAVKKIKAGRKFALSGTPIENRLTELWSVFDFVMKGYLGSRKEFTEEFEKAGDKEELDENLEELRKKISPFVLRRMKTDVLKELPQKIENTVYSDFVPEQKKMYEAYVMAAKNEVMGIFSEKDASIRILTMLLRLRQICCYPGLFDVNYKKDSGKLILLDEIVESALSQGHRILIFSQFTSMLDIIRERLKNQGKSCFYIDGKTPAIMRNNLVERFNNGEKEIFLVSLKAGGTGLNLVGADTVIHYDPWWNPAVTEQATDRAYRIGQKNSVQVIKLAVKGTIEEKILKLQEVKKNLADSVIKKNEKTISGLTKSEILSLFE